jgi:hypothetical protein
MSARIKSWPRKVVENCLYVSLHCVLPLLVRRGALVAALVVLIKLIGLS